MIVARRYLVSGQVQGVGFRFFTEEAARREGLVGFVKNLADGRVEAVVEGEVQAVERFERAISSGPPPARVDEIQTEDRLPDRMGIGFQIRG